MTRKLTPLKSIRKKCMDCMCEQPKEVKECPFKDCSLYEYRMGRNKERTGVGGHIGQL